MSFLTTSEGSRILVIQPTSCVYSHYSCQHSLNHDKKSLEWFTSYLHMLVFRLEKVRDRSGAKSNVSHRVPESPTIHISRLRHQKHRPFNTKCVVACPFRVVCQSTSAVDARQRALKMPLLVPMSAATCIQLSKIPTLFA